jgi:hypothetical protein
MSYQQVIAGYQDRKKRLRYDKARVALETEGYTGWWRGGVKIFVKKEAIKFSEAKPEPDPRAIQFRDAETTLILMTHMKPLEHRLYETHVRPFPPTRSITKGLSPPAIATLLLETKKIRTYRYIYGLDASRFDGSLGPAHQKVEHGFWKWGVTDPLFLEAIGYQVVNKGHAMTKEGPINYRITGSRMSGDANTAGGNCLLMYGMLAMFGCYLAGDWDYTGSRAGIDYDFVNDGDDSLFMTNIPFTEQVMAAYFTRFGMKMTFEFMTQDFQQATFCQRRLVEVRPGSWTMCRDPFKVLSKTMINPKFKDMAGRAILLNTIAQGELSQLQGMPVLQAFCVRLQQLCAPKLGHKQFIRDVSSIPEFTWYYTKDWQAAQATAVDGRARASFSRAWDISVARQYSIEHEIATWMPNLFEPGIRGLDVQSDPWDFDWRRPEMVSPL